MVWHCGAPGLLALAVADTSVITQTVSLAVGLRCCVSHLGLWGRSREEADTVILQEEQVRG